MAISGGDGSIILTTKVDTSGINKGSVSIKSALQSVDTTVKKVQNSFSAFREQKVTLATLNQAIKDQQYVLNSLNLEYAEYVARGKASSTQAKELKANIDAATVEMKEMQAAAVTLGAKGVTSISKIGLAMRSLLSYFIGIQTIFKVINFSGEASQFATQAEASVQRLIDIYGEAAQSVGNFIDANARAIGMSKSAGASIAATYGNLLSVWADQETNANLTNSLLNQTAVVASKTGRTTTDVAERIRSGLLGNTEAIEDLGINVNIKTIEITDAFKRIADGRSWEQLNAYEQSQVRTLAILEQSTKKYGTTVAETSATVRNQYQAAYEDFQNTWGQVVNTVLIPVLKVLTQVFTVATKGLQVMAGLSGKTVENSGKTSNNIKQQTKEQEKLNKTVKKSLADFDEIKTLSGQSAENTADAGTGTQVSGIDDLGGSLDGSSYVEEVSGTLMSIMSYVGFGLTAIGLILLFTGHIGWGIGFIIAGAAILGVTQAAISDSSFDFSSQLSTIIGGVGLLIAAIGIILLLKTKSPLAHSIGIGMIIAGAGIFAVGAVQTVANNIGGDIGNMLHGIIAIVSGFLLAIGIIMLFMGQVNPLSIGLIITGAVGLASEIALYPDAVKEALQGWVGAIFAIVSVALLVIGIILCASGVVTPLTVGMIVVGAAGLATEIALNWNAIKENVQKFFTENGALIAGVSLALLVIGVLLCFAQIWGLGIGLIAAGAAGLVAVVAINWNSIKTAIVNTFNAVVDWIKTYGLLVLGIILCLTGAGIPLGIALIIKWAKDGAEKGVPLATAIVDKVKEIWAAVKQFWNTYIAPIFTAKWWADLGKKALNGLIGIFEKGINFIIGKINAFVRGIDSVVSKVGDIFGADWSVATIPEVKIPRLAKGAVIPPNREFLAVLGDQKHGTNIEAPLQTIVDAFNIALQGNANYGGGNTEVILEIDGREFGRAVVEQGNRENRRIGTRLVIA